MTERWDNGFWGIEGMGIASPAPHYKGGKFEGNAEKKLFRHFKFKFTSGTFSGLSGLVIFEAGFGKFGVDGNGILSVKAGKTEIFLGNFRCFYQVVNI
jgi:hypothetical protein